MADGRGEEGRVQVPVVAELGMAEGLTCAKYSGGDGLRIVNAPFQHLLPISSLPASVDTFLKQLEEDSKATPSTTISTPPPHPIPTPARASVAIFPTNPLSLSPTTPINLFFHGILFRDLKTSSLPLQRYPWVGILPLLGKFSEVDLGDALGDVPSAGVGRFKPADQHAHKSETEDALVGVDPEVLAALSPEDLAAIRGDGDEWFVGSDSARVCSEGDMETGIAAAWVIMVDGERNESFVTLWVQAIEKEYDSVDALVSVLPESIQSFCKPS